ncbi:hypothetical protein [Spirosoma sp.]|uniref:hypothetical protein n=1 Tax=Spirosoma sp. TaxID=1899569 RepID=UPI002611E8AC|nr:hypothetical protein [Spirosoma sp.]MCX6217661.1 hypothetical protein [Spirosoma sp.]
MATQAQKEQAARLLQLKAITGYKAVDCGKDLPDYFKGLSAIDSGFDEVVVGVGDSAYEAYHDALDNMSLSADTAYMPQRHTGFTMGKKLSQGEISVGWRYYVGIYYTLSK